MSDARRWRRSIFEVPLHDGGAQIKPWIREELMDEMLEDQALEHGMAEDYPREEESSSSAP